jgi:hypothetical protein
MREFKPMVKMETTEPTVELKLKKGGAVKKMAGGGMPMGAMIGAPKGGMMPGAKPKKPSLAARRRAMMAQGAAGAPSGRAESMMAATPPAMPAMKKGGEMESSKVHKAEMKKLSGIKKELTKHEKMPASKGHRGLKTGGVVKGNAGYKAGGAVDDGCGYKTGGVAKANAGGFAKGGAIKKFAKGGRVQHDGGPEQMPQGRKKPAGPVSINQLSGTYKKGGAVMMASGGAVKSAAQTAAEQRMASQKAASTSVSVQQAEQRKAAEQKMASQKAASTSYSVQQAEKAKAAAKPQIAGLNPVTGRFDPGAMEYKGPPVSLSVPKPVPTTKPKIEGLNPLTGRFDPRAPEYMGPRVTPSMPTTMPKPKPSVMPVPSGKYDRPTLLPKDEMAIPAPVPRVESTAYRRGGKVQNKGKKRGGAVC